MVDRVLAPYAVELFERTTCELEVHFHKLEAQVSPPILAHIGSETAYRYQAQTLEAAAIQKLARVISGLNAGRILLEAGFVQELGALQRSLDEFTEDILFLCDPLLGGERTELCDRFLENFYAEEFDDAANPLASSQDRPQIPRQKIRAAVIRNMQIAQDPSTALETHRTIAKAYGGFVHGASPQIMELYGGSPPHFHLAGMLRTPRMGEHTRDYWNYVHRGINSTGYVAYAIGDRARGEEIRNLRLNFEKESGCEL